MTIAKARKDPTWPEVIEKVLRDQGRAMQLSEIAQAIVDSGLQQKSAKPATSVGVALTNSL
jgi:HB1, ASXL, restriction endonuclease HTH domain